MKKVVLLFIAIAFILTSRAQDNTSGTVVYEELIKLDIKLEGDAAQFAHMMPKERKSNKLLYFNPEASLYENEKAPEDETMEMESEGASIGIKIKVPENVVYTDLESRRQLEQREFMTRMFLIESEVQHQWKLTGNQKLILDFPCQEAITEKDSALIKVWFTPAIPVSAGPELYGGLPGMILALEADNGKKTITATSVDFAPVDKNVLAKPKKGKKVTREEYDAIVKEKMEEMGAEGGQGRHMMIRIQR